MEEAAVNGKTRRRPVRRRVLTALAVLALGVPAGIAHAQQPPIYEIPPVPPPPAQPPGGSDGPRMLRPFPAVRTAGRYSRVRTRFRRVSVAAPEGAVVRTRCRRTRCTSRRTVGARGRLRVRKLERAFKPGAVIVLTVTAEDAIGKHVQIRIRRGSAPLRRDRCVDPGSISPRSCPSP
jgi:hypothetical protein